MVQAIKKVFEKIMLLSQYFKYFSELTISIA
jgi:hypothetical protein